MLCKVTRSGAYPSPSGYTFPLLKDSVYQCTGTKNLFEYHLLGDADGGVAERQKEAGV